MLLAALIGAATGAVAILLHVMLGFAETAGLALGRQ